MVQIVQGTTGQADFLNGSGAGVTPGDWTIYASGFTVIATNYSPGEWNFTSGGVVTVPDDAGLGEYLATYTNNEMIPEEPGMFQTDSYEFEVTDGTIADEALGVNLDPATFCPGDEITALATHVLTGPSTVFYASSDSGFTTPLATVSLTPTGSGGDLFGYTFTAPTLAAGEYRARFSTSEAIYMPVASVAITRAAECPGDPPPPETGLKVVLHRWV